MAMGSSSHLHPPREGSWNTSRLLWPLIPDCREAVRLISQERDGLLSLTIRWRVALHRQYCTHCQRYAEQLALIGEASRRWRAETNENGWTGLGDGAKARLKLALTQDARTHVPFPAPPDRPNTRPAR